MEIHVTSTGNYKKRGYNVNMAFIVPKNIKNYPWVFLFTKRSYIYLSPLLIKTPQEIFQVITTLIKGYNLLILTRGKLKLVIN